ncbi:hypothetical protein AOXY_G37319 [Acipenser oxyrinchus oxyrinchus]|uniref:NKAP domain containing 1 n=1 Tax=Acipenser oxyrinchus oxyrinchus TaxID=40147 RepID=A0AAD8CEV1_ACIOX|nr:hypothetical protein AOXY_G37319 [Acipenser oxyrinchus oxyrinchus]
MSRVPVGKVLLRNVIRHTDAHNKIQEESEMWKMREMEKQTPVIQQKWQPTKPAPDFGRCKMRSDRSPEETHSERRGAPAGHTSEQDRREAKHWTKKLYDFEASDPNRWGHSGFRELYPEEFHTHSDSSNSDEKNDRKKKKTLQRSKASQQHTRKHKRSKKSNKKKQKKQSSKNRKERRERTASHPATRQAQARVTEKRGEPGGNGKEPRKKSSEGKKESSEDSDSDTSSSSESEPRDERKKRKRKLQRGESEQGSDGRKSKHKNWKLTTEDTSQESSEHS